MKTKKNRSDKQATEDHLEVIALKAIAVIGLFIAPLKIFKFLSTGCSDLAFLEGQSNICDWRAALLTIGWCVILLAPALVMFRPKKNAHFGDRGQRFGASWPRSPKCAAGVCG